MLSWLIGHVGEAGLIVGVMLSLNAGRKLAMRLHDVELARRHGRRLGGISFVVYVYLFLGFAVTFMSVVATQLMGGSVKTLIGVLTGHVTAAIYSTAVSIVSAIIGYIMFSRRYRKVEKPLTREGKIALQGISIGKGALNKARKGLGKFKDDE